MPCGRMAAMKPPPLAMTTLGSRIGSPATRDERTMAPTKSLIASGRSVFLMKVALAEAAGQVCQPMSPAPTTWPVLRSVLATSTSTVASGGGGGTALGASGCRRPLASMAATPPAARATPSTIRRAAFITLHVPNDATAGTAVNSGFHQLNVKAWLMRSIQIALIARYAALGGDRIQRLSHTIEPTRGLGSWSEYFRQTSVHLDQVRSGFRLRR